jgi:ABC-2 type transport system permease protein
MTEPLIPDGDQLVTATRYQLQFYLRTLRFLVLLGLIVAIPLIATFVESHYVGISTLRATETPSVFVANTAAFFGEIVVIIAALLGGDAISTDFGARTGYYTLVLPVRRRILFLGRYLAAVLSSWVLTLIWFAAVLLACAYFFHAVPAEGTVGAVGIAFLYAAATMGLAFFFSSLSKSPSVSIVLTFLILLIALPIVTSIISGVANIEPWFSLTYASDAITLPLVTTAHIGVGGAYFPTLGEGLAIMVVYLAAFLLVGYVLYEFKESTG